MYGTQSDNKRQNGAVRQINNPSSREMCIGWKTSRLLNHNKEDTQHLFVCLVGVHWFVWWVLISLLGGCSLVCLVGVHWLVWLVFISLFGGCSLACLVGVHWLVWLVFIDLFCGCSLACLVVVYWLVWWVFIGLGVCLFVYLIELVSNVRGEHCDAFRVKSPVMFFPTIKGTFNK